MDFTSQSVHLRCGKKIEKLKRKIFSVKRPRGHNNDIIITIIAQGKIYKKYQKIQEIIILENGKNTRKRKFK